MHSDHSIFILGHKFRFIPGILFLDYRVNTSLILLDTCVVFSELVVIVYGALIHSLINIGYYQAFAFSQYNGAELASPGCFLWLHMGVSHTMQFYCFHTFVFAIPFCLDCVPVSPLKNIYFSFTGQIKNSSQTADAHLPPIAFCSFFVVVVVPQHLYPN